MVIDRKTYIVHDLPVVGGQAPQPAARGPNTDKSLLHDVNERYARKFLRRNSVWVGRADPGACIMDGLTRQPSYDGLADPKLAETGPPSPVGLRRGSLLSLRERRLVGLGRLELPTSRLSSARSNQLSYKP